MCLGAEGEGSGTTARGGSPGRLSRTRAEPRSAFLVARKGTGRPSGRIGGVSPRVGEVGSGAGPVAIVEDSGGTAVGVGDGSEGNRKCLGAERRVGVPVLSDGSGAGP